MIDVTFCVWVFCFSKGEGERDVQDKSEFMISTNNSLKSSSSECGSVAVSFHPVDT